MILVCNAGPIIALAKVDRLELLQGLSREVVIPETVFHEVLAKPGRDAMRIQAAARAFLQVRSDFNPVDPAVAHATRHLDLGEQAVICLTSVVPAPVRVILDDAAGRRVARFLGLPVIGFIGILLAAKKAGAVPAVIPLLEEARNQGYWLSDGLMSAAAVLAAEEWKC